MLLERSLNKYELGNCAEVDAINNALNDGSLLSNLHIYTIHVTKNNYGLPKVSCQNCIYAFKGKVKSNNSRWWEE